MKTDSRKQGRRQEPVRDSVMLGRRCLECMRVLLEVLDVELDRQLAETILRLVTVIIMHHHHNQGLVLSKLEGSDVMTTYALLLDHPGLNQEAEEFIHCVAVKLNRLRTSQSCLTAEQEIPLGVTNPMLTLWNEG